MTETIRLGGNIELVNANAIDGASMIILKKMIGNYARQFSERGVNGLSVTFADDGVIVDALFDTEKVSTSATSPNVFFAVDSAFKSLESQL